MKEKEIKYIVEKIMKLRSSISNEFYQHYMNSNFEDEYYEEFPGYTDEWLKQTISDLYYLILAYLEVKNLPNSYETFKNRFSKLIEGKVDLLIEEQYHPDEEPNLKILNEFAVHLNPYSDFSFEKKIDDELSKIHSILQNTNHILKKLQVEIKGEADIYNAVKWTIGLFHPKTRAKNKASFIQEFKTYEPDILIPDLKTSIEYKYIKTDNDNLIDDYIDQIKIDSVNYVGDYRYDNFIAVIYLKSCILTTPEKIKESWKSKNFPKNWKLIISSD